MLLILVETFLVLLHPWNSPDDVPLCPPGHSNPPPTHLLSLPSLGCVLCPCTAVWLILGSGNKKISNENILNRKICLEKNSYNLFLNQFILFIPQCNFSEYWVCKSWVPHSQTEKWGASIPTHNFFYYPQINFGRLKIFFMCTTISAMTCWITEW